MVKGGLHPRGAAMVMGNVGTSPSGSTVALLNRELTCWQNVTRDVTGTSAVHGGERGGAWVRTLFKFRMFRLGSRHTEEPTFSHCNATLGWLHVDGGAQRQNIVVIRMAGPRWQVPGHLSSGVGWNGTILYSIWW